MSGSALAEIKAPLNRKATVQQKIHAQHRGAYSLHPFPSRKLIYIANDLNVDQMISVG